MAARIKKPALASKAANGVAKKLAWPDRVLEARYVRPARLLLRFADGFEGTWSFPQLGLDMGNIKCTTVRASASGKFVSVRSKWGDDVQLDPSALRVLIDPVYAAAIEKRLDELARKIGL